MPFDLQVIAISAVLWNDFSSLVILRWNMFGLNLLLPIPCSCKEYHLAATWHGACKWYKHTTRHVSCTIVCGGTYVVLQLPTYNSIRPVKWSPTRALKKLIWCFLHSYLPMTTPQTSSSFNIAWISAELADIASNKWEVMYGLYGSMF